MEFLYPANHRVLAYVRQFSKETVLVVNNLSGAAQAVELDLGRYEGNILDSMVGRIFSADRRSALLAHNGSLSVLLVPATMPKPLNLWCGQFRRAFSSVLRDVCHYQCDIGGLHHQLPDLSNANSLSTVTPAGEPQKCMRCALCTSSPPEYLHHAPLWNCAPNHSFGLPTCSALGHAW